MIGRFSPAHAPARKTAFYNPLVPLAAGNSVLIAVPLMARRVRVYANVGGGAWNVAPQAGLLSLPVFNLAAGVVDSGWIDLYGDCPAVQIGVPPAGIAPMSAARLIFELM
jgi:hypothetical protein